MKNQKNFWHNGSFPLTSDFVHVRNFTSIVPGLSLLSLLPLTTTTITKKDNRKKYISKIHNFEFNFLYFLSLEHMRKTPSINFCCGFDGVNANIEKAI